jgi:broad specificity phosphatase PhoE
MEHTKPIVYLIRHGETDWSLSGQHTGKTDKPLTENGRLQAVALRDALQHISFEAVFSSPRIRAMETAKLAGLPAATIYEDLAEFDYGEYEGLTTAEIRKQVPEWTVWTHPCPGGETLQSVEQRATNIIELINQKKGNVAIASHGHFLRIFATTWLGLAPTNGGHFMLDTATVSILSHERETPAIKSWNLRHL